MSWTVSCRVMAVNVTLAHSTKIKHTHRFAVTFMIYSCHHSFCQMAKNLMLVNDRPDGPDFHVSDVVVVF